MTAENAYVLVLVVYIDLVVLCEYDVHGGEERQGRELLRNDHCR